MSTVCECEYQSGVEMGSTHVVGCPALLLAAGKTRTFETGATRDTDDGKLDFEGFFSPGVMYAFAQYMQDNRVQSDGSVRDSDNWQKGIPRDQYMKSMYRHFMEVWSAHRCNAVEVNEDALCALMFNVMGYLFEMQEGR